MVFGCYPDHVVLCGGRFMLVKLSSDDCVSVLVEISTANRGILYGKFSINFLVLICFFPSTVQSAVYFILHSPQLKR
ncbi:Uncharacterized protein APZ42_024339 [Daphnia magna]|uniref:Uncharacterized protein n=1 Tax=Daphnia magna TaxID=35525 RepID=A0A164UND2_9CRUS|nr:Uncharacterized protein APZ42_024339 [Daphnia magna]